MKSYNLPKDPNATKINLIYVGLAGLALLMLCLALVPIAKVQHESVASAETNPPPQKVEERVEAVAAPVELDGSIIVEEKRPTFTFAPPSSKPPKIVSEAEVRKMSGNK